MNFYQRYASGEHDKEFFKQKRSKENKIRDEKLDLFRVPPLAGQFGNFSPKEESFLTMEEWSTIFENGAVFFGYDEVLFGYILILVHEDIHSKKISTKSLTRFGYTCYTNLILDEKSRFWPSCENLLFEFKNSNVRRALAITNLKNYNALANNPGNLNFTKHWDETNAGELASKMDLIADVPPNEISEKLLRMGLLQPHYTRSVLVDVIYQNTANKIQSNMMSDNDKIVYQLGEQSDHLFDPLLEYCPQEMETFYTPPDLINYSRPLLFDNPSIDNILEELLAVQKNFTLGLVGLLQDFIIPIRIHVLELGSTSGISKINQVFPPTIDEITRINCILHDFLEKAIPFGYIEVFKVMGMMMPYFYKAFIRHEANLKGFTPKLTKFFNRNKKKVLSSKVVNKTSYTAKEVDSIVSGSLFELPRIKLILERLYNAIETEKVKLRNFEETEDQEESVIDVNFRTAIDIIEAFGGDGDKEYRNVDISQRIFTPTGKILTEIASKWPPELQYGWLSRKVVGIFELNNIFPDNLDVKSEVLIIFSDHLMFLSVYNSSSSSDEENIKGDEPNTELSISDILMHSLVNEKPLPKLSSLPYMEVNSWSDINEVVVSCYKAPDKLSTEKELLRFICTSPSGFKNTSTTTRVSVRNYEVINNKNSYSESSRVVELVDKSRILRKNQPFHLFKSVDECLHIYSTAQTMPHYEKEISKSPIGLFLNISLENPESYFNVYPNLLTIIIITVLNDHQFELEVYDKLKESKVREVVLYNNLITFLEEIISTTYSGISSTTNFISDKLRETYQSNIAYYLKSIMPDMDTSLSLISNTTPLSKKDIHSNNNVKNFNKVIMKPAKLPESTEKVASNKNNIIPKKKRLSFIRRVFRPFRKSSKNHVSFEDIESIKTVNYSNKGEEREFVHLYSPVPKLLKESENKVHENDNKTTENGESVDVTNKNQSDVQDNSELSDTANQYRSEKVENIKISDHNITEALGNSKVMDTSLLFSNQTTHSLDINSQFIFPERTEGSIVREVSAQFNENLKTNADGELIHGNITLLPRELPVKDLNKIKEVQGECDTISVHSYNISGLSYELFYKDGAANWVSLARDNSFLLHEEVQALKEDANMDTEDVIVVNENDSVHMKSLFYNLELGSTSSEKFYTPYAEPTERFMNNNSPLSPYGAPNQLKTDISIQSLSSSQIINEFSNAINFDTSMDDELNYRFSSYSSDASVSNYVNVKSSSYITVNTNSSEDEFYSPDEFDQRSRFVQRLPSTTNSFSSEATIINEMLTDNIPISKTDPDQNQKNIHSNRSSLTRDIAYLSDVINGTNSLNTDL